MWAVVVFDDVEPHVILFSDHGNATDFAKEFEDNYCFVVMCEYLAMDAEDLH